MTLTRTQPDGDVLQAHAFDDTAMGASHTDRDSRLRLYTDTPALQPETDSVEFQPGSTRVSLITEIVESEMNMMEDVPASRPSSAQRHPLSVAHMRWITHLVLPISVLESYLADLKRASRRGINLMINTNAHIEGAMLQRPHHPVLRKAAEAEAQWMEELEQDYPLMMRNLEAAFAGYMFLDLRECSPTTIRYYGNAISHCVADGGNLEAERYYILCRTLGYESLEAYEEKERAEALA